MLIFDIKNNPPTQSEIQTERESLLKQKRQIFERTILSAAGIMTLCLASLYWLWFTDQLAVDGGLSEFSIGVVALIVMTAGILIGVIAVASLVTIVFTLIATGASAGACVAAVFARSDPLSPTIAATSAGMIIGILIGSWGANKLDNILSKILQLNYLNDESGLYKDRCKSVIRACERNEECWSYAAKVSEMGRSLTVEEADMIEAWLVSSKARKEEVEQERVREIACAKLKNLHQA